ncbi:uncharacterized protein ABDE67_012662 [Symphorus nematophorus]
MVTLDVRTLTVPVGIVRILEVILTCITFILVASMGHSWHSFWTWCMFTWCFCFCVTLLILILELTSLSAKLPISWDDFTAAYAMLATLMMLTASIIFPSFYVCSTCGRSIGATVTSSLAFILYAVEVGLNRAKPGEISGFLSTVPGLLKVLEAFVACIIFICLDSNMYQLFPGLQWCVAVYSICFIFALIVIIFTICRLLALFPVPFDKILTGCNVLAVLMYITAAVIWPLYSFRNYPRPSICSNLGVYCAWNNLVVISCMTCFNLVAYIVDTVYSFRLVFFVSTMVFVDLKSVTQPVGIMRIMAAIVTCMTFVLVATGGHHTSPLSYWAWCMFTWCFCFFFTFLILILEFTTVSTKLPFAWDDFTAAFAMLAGLMCLSASIIYPIFFNCKDCHREIGASVVSWVCFGVYAGEVALTRLRPSGQTSGFLSTLPGIMKILETFLACLIFTSLEKDHFSHPGLRWCVAVYSLCFIFAILIILLTLGGLTNYLPFSFDKLAIVYNILATVMYMTAMVIWPLYSFHKRYPPDGYLLFEKQVVVTVMTIFNCIVYALDTAYSVRLVFCGSNQ